MAYLSYIVTIVLVVLSGIFALLANVAWAGFVYFLFAMLILLSLFWTGWLIFKYFTDFQRELEHEFTVFRAETLIAEKIKAEQFDNNLEAYKKLFKKKMLKTKLIRWGTILLCVGFVAMFIFGIIYY